LDFCALFNVTIKIVFDSIFCFIFLLIVLQYYHKTWNRHCNLKKLGVRIFHVAEVAPGVALVVVPHFTLEA
jgi:hypothetical protein